MRLELLALPIATADAFLRGTPTAIIAIGGAIFVRLMIDAYLARAVR